MKKLAAFLFLFPALFFICPRAKGQIAAYLGGGGGLVNGMGTRNPNWTPMAGIEAGTRKTLFNVEFSADTANKIDAGSGVLFRFVAHGYLTHKRFFFGGGMSRTQLYTSAYDKSAWHPRAAVGYQGRGWSVFGDYILPHGDPQNSVQGAQVRFEIPINRRLSFRYDTEIVRFHSTLQEQDRHWGGTSTFLLIFHLPGRERK